MASKKADIKPSLEEQPPICVYETSEKALLSCIMKQPSILGHPEFEDDLLYREDNRLILQALRDLWDQGEADNSVAYDWVTVIKPRFARHPDLAKMGGIEELSRIYGMEPIGRDSSGRDGWCHHADLLKDARSKRDVYFTSLRLQELARNPPTDYRDKCRFEIESLNASIERSDSIPPWLKPVPASQLDRTKPPIVIGGLLYQGQKMMVTAGSKSMKSWVLLSIAYCIANEIEFLDFPTRRHKVLYLDFELQSWEAVTRLDMISEALGIGTIDKIDIINLRGHAAEFHRHLPAIKRLIKRGGYKVVILDPMYKMMMEVDENSNSNIARTLDEFTVLCEECDVALIYSHHHSKGNQADKDAKDRGSGAGSWMRDPDAGFDLTPHKQQDHFSLEITPRSFKKPEPFVVRWELPILKRDQDTIALDPLELKRPNRFNAQKWSDNQIIELLRPHDGDWSRYDLQRACIDELSMSKPTASERVSKLIAAKTISVSKIDKNQEGDFVLLLNSSYAKT